MRWEGRTRAVGLGREPQHPGPGSAAREPPARRGEGARAGRGRFTALTRPRGSGLANFAVSAEGVSVCFCPKQGFCGFGPFVITQRLIKITQPVQDRGGLSLCGKGTGGGKRVPRRQMIRVNDPKGNAGSAWLRLIPPSLLLTVRCKDLSCNIQPKVLVVSMGKLKRLRLYSS